MSVPSGSYDGIYTDVFFRNRIGGRIFTVYCQDGRVFCGRNPLCSSRRNAGRCIDTCLAENKNEEEFRRNYSQNCVCHLYNNDKLGVVAFGTYHVLRIGGEKTIKENISSAPLNMESEDGKESGEG